MSDIMDIKYAAAATFSSAKDLFSAAGKVKEKGYTNWECFTPMPVHGLDGQMGYPRSKVPRFTLAKVKRGTLDLGYPICPSNPCTGIGVKHSQLVYPFSLTLPAALNKSLADEKVAAAAYLMSMISLIINGLHGDQLEA